jgi:ATP-dependent helicase Lhr and Lhr-like helicase
VRYGGSSRADAESRLTDEYGLDERAARNLLDYLAEQREPPARCPTDRDITIERFRDELGDWRVCILTPFGARVHAPWAIALRAIVSDRVGYEVQTVWSDDGIVLTIADGDVPPDAALLVPAADELDERIIAELPRSPVFATEFRENAARALLMPRRRPGQRTPLFAQRLRAQQLMGIALQYPSFPIVIETFRSCLQDVFDVPALRDRAAQRRVRRDPRARCRDRGRVAVRALPRLRVRGRVHVRGRLAVGGTPRAGAVGGHQLLRELLGEADLRELLDAGIIADVEDSLQRRTAGRRLRDADDVHDALRQLGDLTLDEVRERAGRCGSGALAEGAENGARVRCACGCALGRDAWIAAEDAGLYRDALGTAPPPGWPASSWSRWSARRDAAAPLVPDARPFATTDVAARFGIVPAQADLLLQRLAAEDRLLHGAFRPGGTDDRVVRS